MTTYFGILTKVGEAKEANAKALGIPVHITELEVGDGGGVLPVPDREQTALIGSRRRAAINRKFVDPVNPNWLVIEQVIPEQFGGWWIRELGLRDADGDLVAVANCPPTYKPQLAEGSARTQVVRMVLLVSSTANFTLKVDPAVVLATRGYVDEEAAKKLGKTETAVAATKLATARKISASGAAKAAAKEFNGEKDIDLELSDLDMGKATKGTLPVARGGTGLTDVPDGHLLIGAPNGKMRTATFFSMIPARHFPLIHSIAALPSEDVGPIVVAEVSEVWIWQETPFFTGYRSPLCGRPVDGHTVAPLACEVDGVGGLLPKAIYRGLWGFAQENGLVVSQETWSANIGAHYFVDVNSTQFRVPDIRNMMRRYTGTDADSSSPRWSGSRQLDALQRITGGFHAVSDFNSEFPVVWSQDGVFIDGGTGLNAPSIEDIISQEKPTRRTGFDSARVTRSSSETRPMNVAYHPRIHA
ncbi:phage tail protein [Achromobacter anxifer]